MTAKKDYDHFIGLWRHKQHGWEIKYQQNGKKSSEFRKDEREAKLRADYWKATLGVDPEDTNSDDEHPVIYWEKMLRQAAELLIRNPTDKDVASSCRSVAAMATAAMRTAKYIPAPAQDVSDGTSVSGDISNLSTEDMEKLLGTTNSAGSSD